MVSASPVADLLTMAKADWWPVDKVVLTYMGSVTAIELFYWSRLPNPWERLITHLACTAIVALAAHYPANRAARLIHYWYPLPYVSYCYKEMGILIPSLERPNADAVLAHIDLAFWGANPTVWLEGFSRPLLAEALEMCCDCLGA